MRARRSQGFTYLMLLWWVAISGFMLMALSRSWIMESRREKEMELVFRGDQIRRAIEAYAKVPVAEKAVRLPASLDDLLADRRSGTMVRHLRQVWPDPVTGQAWGLVRHGEHIKGVYSLSPQTPIRAPEGVSTYMEWRFEASQESVMASQ